MSLEVFLHPSTTSPPQDLFAAAVDVALASVGAVRDADGEGVTTAEGSTFELFLDGQDDIALLSLDIIDDSVAAAVFAVMEGTRSFMLSAGFVCRTPTTGGVVPSLAMSFPQASDIRNPEELQEILHSAVRTQDEGEPGDEEFWTPTDEDLEAAAMAAAPPPEADPIVSKPERPLFQRISDALFGKSI